MKSPFIPRCTKSKWRQISSSLCHSGTSPATQWCWLRRRSKKFQGRCSTISEDVVSDQTLQLKPKSASSSSNYLRQEAWEATSQWTKTTSGPRRRRSSFRSCSSRVSIFLACRISWSRRVCRLSMNTSSRTTLWTHSTSTRLKACPCSLSSSRSCTTTSPTPKWCNKILSRCSSPSKCSISNKWQCLPMASSSSTQICNLNNVGSEHEVNFNST